MLEYAAAGFALGCLFGIFLRGVVEGLMYRLESLGDPIHPRELPPHVRAEVQDLDQWTGYRRRAIRP